MFYSTFLQLLLASSILKFTKCQDTVDTLEQLKEAVDKTLPKLLPKSTIDNFVYYPNSIIGRLPVLPILFAESAANLMPDDECGSQSRIFLRELQSGTFWAARMYDSSTKYPEGMIYASSVNYGNYDECYEIPIHGGINTRTCLIDFNFPKTNSTNVFYHYAHSIVPDQSISGWKRYIDNRRTLRNNRYILRTFLCVPSACSPKQVEAALKKPVKELTLDTHSIKISQDEVDLSITVNPTLCQAAGEFPKRYRSPIALLYFGLLAVIFILIFLGTSYDREDDDSAEDNAKSHVSSNSKTKKRRKSSSTFRDICLCFSLRRTIKGVFILTSDTHPLDNFSGTRLFCTALVTFGHRYLQYLVVPMINEMSALETFDKWWFMIILNATVIIDFFLCIGAMSATFCWLETLDAGKPLNFISVVVRRYLRLTPSYLLIIGLYIFVMPYLSTGHLWGYKMYNEAEYCYQNWWLNLLYINNHFNVNNFCMFQTWYVCVEFQMHCASYFAIRYFWKLPRKKGYCFLLFLCLFAISISIIVTYIDNWPPSLFCKQIVNDLRDYPSFIGYYIKTHVRMSSYIVGLLMGAIFYDLHKSKYRIPRNQTLLLHFSALALLITVVLYPNKYENPNSVTGIEAALYSGLHRPLAALFCSIMMTAVAFGDNVGLLRMIHQTKWLLPFRKLSYGFFLAHHINQLFSSGSSRLPKEFRAYTIFTDYIVDFSITFAIALFLWVAVEAPVCHLMSLFSHKKISRIYGTAVPEKAD